MAIPGMPPGSTRNVRVEIVLGLCTCCGFLSVADRSTLSVLTIDMKRELQWTTDEEAAVVSAFFYGYFCSQLAGAHLCTLHGAATVLQWAMLMWSLCTVLTPHSTAVSVSATVVCRFMLGLFEGVTVRVTSTQHACTASPARQQPWR